MNTYFRVGTVRITNETTQAEWPCGDATSKPFEVSPGGTVNINEITLKVLDNREPQKGFFNVNDSYLIVGKRADNSEELTLTNMRYVGPAPDEPYIDYEFSK